MFRVIVAIQAYIASVSRDCLSSTGLIVSILSLVRGDFDCEKVEGTRKRVTFANCMKPHLCTLPILEHWVCHHCTACCRGTTIQLTPDDLQRLQQQKWDQDRHYRGIQTVRRSSWLTSGPVLAQQADGSCIFLTDSGRCRIHEKFGLEAKPFMCQLFPLKVVSTDRDSYATVLRSCPSAAADRGRPLNQQLQFLKRLLGNESENSATPTAPPLLRRTARSWDDFYRVVDAIQRLLTDNRFPLVRRLAHCLRFCSLLEECKWKRVGTEAVAELIEVLEQSACGDVGALFQDREPPSSSTARLFRRLGVHFIRCFPGGQPTLRLSDQWKVFRLSGQLARSTRLLPELHPRFPAIQLDQLESPLGPLSENVLKPLTRFYESHAVSKRYALANSSRSVVVSFRQLAFTFPMALWMLRWLAVERQPEREDMIPIVVAIERGIALRGLSRAAGYLAETGQLDRLIAWYSR